MPSINEDLKERENKVYLPLFADDSAFFTSVAWPNATVMRMQRQLDKLPQWLAQWRVSVNMGKTAAICTTKKRPPSKLKLDGHAIDWASSTKYLGVIIDKNLSMASPHAEETIIRSRGARAALRPILASNLPLGTKVPTDTEGLLAPYHTACSRRHPTPTYPHIHRPPQPKKPNKYSSPLLAFNLRFSGAH
ncbi:hypothetical protein evm_006778 [Chilo suppressalis]|nr:hypothetical protein evm_006778 [Chilo suppressalis]